MNYYRSPNFNCSTKRFEHPSGDNNERKFLQITKVASEYFWRDYDEWEYKGFPTINPSKIELAHFSESVIWVGHSTVMMNHNGVTVLTDPHFTKRAGPFGFMGPKRITPPPFLIEDLPKIDIIIISHNHYDHLDRQSIIRLTKLQPEIKFFAPLGLSQILKSLGVKDIIELDWWQSVKYKNIIIHATQVQHWSRRSFYDRNRTLWSGWMITWDDFSFYFAGDAGYSKDFVETANRCGSPTLAAIPIGAYEPREFMKPAHINPEEAVKAFQDLNTKYAFGIHWGTFKLTLELMNEPPIQLKKCLKKAGVSQTKFKCLVHGEQWKNPFKNVN
ncbi:MAG: Zn-dependent hydrolase [Rhodobacteraceae bacterium]|nr:Zn-dependent hydrolase [Paracoccaceae bacterium]|tara:strand:+ start:1279 stop:2268 length:990 start_codon:yes stop_codon:yes gene_type:complete